MGIGHPIFISASGYSSFYQDSGCFSTNSTQLSLLYICTSDSVSGSAHFCWGGCLLSQWKKLSPWGFRNATDPAFLLFLMTVSLWSGTLLHPSLGEKEVQQMARPFWVSASWPCTISLLEFCFCRGVSEYCLCLQFHWDWLFNYLMG